MSEILFNQKLSEQPEQAYDSLTTMGENLIYFPEQMENDYDESDPVRLESVLAIQALAMGSLRHIARARLRRDKRHGFCILAETEQSSEAYDGALEEYMSYRIAKNSFADWSMRVRFRQNERLQHKKRASDIDDYRFAWNRQGELTESSLNLHHVESDGYTSRDSYQTIRPVSNQEVIDLHDRMHEHVEKSGAWPEDSYMKLINSHAA